MQRWGSTWAPYTGFAGRVMLPTSILIFFALHYPVSLSLENLKEKNLGSGQNPANNHRPMSWRLRYSLKPFHLRMGPCPPMIIVYASWTIRSQIASASMGSASLSRHPGIFTVLDGLYTYIVTAYSTVAEAVSNPAEIDAQFAQWWCSISHIILIFFAQLWRSPSTQVLFCTCLP